MTKINLTYLNELCGGDADFLSELLQTYIDETGRDVDYLAEALTQSDIPRIGFWAHKIKAAFKMLGLNLLAEKAELLEYNSKKANSKMSDFNEHVIFIVENAKVSFKQAQRLLDSF